MPNKSYGLAATIESIKNNWIEYSTEIKSNIFINVSIKTQTNYQSTSKILITDWKTDSKN